MREQIAKKDPLTLMVETDPVGEADLQTGDFLGRLVK